MSLRSYYQLAKPGIIYANLLTATAGYFLASQWQVHWLVLVGLLGGLAAVIASACICNNILDQSIDRRMQRTQRRALITGEITVKTAVIVTVVLGITGLVLLASTQYMLVTLLAAIAYVDYTLLYGWGKRHSAHGTLIGCISGAIPLVAGYVAARHSLDAGAGLLFVLMVAWQMAHFFGIALLRVDDYRAARIPVMPVAYGERSTKLQALGYMVLFIVVAICLGVFKFVHPVVAGLLVLMASYWLLQALRDYHRLASLAWGRQVFMLSLLVMCVMSLGFIASPLL